MPSLPITRAAPLPRALLAAKRSRSTVGCRRRAGSPPQNAGGFGVVPVLHRGPAPPRSCPRAGAAAAGGGPTSRSGTGGCGSLLRFYSPARRVKPSESRWFPPAAPSGRAEPRAPQLRTPSRRVQLPQHQSAGREGPRPGAGDALPFEASAGTGTLCSQQTQHLPKNCPELYTLKFDTTYI